VTDSKGTHNKKVPWVFIAKAATSEAVIIQMATMVSGKVSTEISDGDRMVTGTWRAIAFY
jgi:hypothetical protein